MLKSKGIFNFGLHSTGHTYTTSLTDSISNVSEWSQCSVVYKMGWSRPFKADLFSLVNQSVFSLLLYEVH